MTTPKVIVNCCVKTRTLSSAHIKAMCISCGIDVTSYFKRFSWIITETKQNVDGIDYNNEISQGIFYPCPIGEGLKMGFAKVTVG